MVRQVLAQTRARVLRADTHFPDKIVSVFEPHTEIIRKGKLAKPIEFGRRVMIQEAEAQPRLSDQSQSRVHAQCLACRPFPRESPSALEAPNGKITPQGIVMPEPGHPASNSIDVVWVHQHTGISNDLRQ